MRVRLDDTDPEIHNHRSKSKISDKGLSFNSDPPRAVSPNQIELDELESINGNIPAARDAELHRLREENAELQERLKYINKKVDVPLAMTTFSPRKESGNVEMPSLTEAKDSQGNRL